MESGLRIYQLRPNQDNEPILDKERPEIIIKMFVQINECVHYKVKWYTKPIVDFEIVIITYPCVCWIAPADNSKNENNNEENWRDKSPT